jgi:hypothetical protein
MTRWAEDFDSAGVQAARQVARGGRDARWLDMFEDIDSAGVGPRREGRETRCGAEDASERATVNRGLPGRGRETATRGRYARCGAEDASERATVNRGLPGRGRRTAGGGGGGGDIGRGEMTIYGR